MFPRKTKYLGWGRRVWKRQGEAFQAEGAVHTNGKNIQEIMACSGAVKRLMWLEWNWWCWKESLCKQRPSMIKTFGQLRGHIVCFTWLSLLIDLYDLFIVTEKKIELRHKFYNVPELVVCAFSVLSDWFSPRKWEVGMCSHLGAPMSLTWSSFLQLQEPQCTFSNFLHCQFKLPPSLLQMLSGKHIHFSPHFSSS